MSSAFESWADAFHFSEDLEDLEAIYHQEQQVSLNRQAETLRAESSQSPSEDERFLDALADKIAYRLARHITATDAFKLHEYQRDNQRMARQIKILLERARRAEMENGVLKEEAQEYRHLVGNFYYKSS